MKNLEFVELNAQELEEVNGGHVPTAFYMDDSTIKQNGENMATFFGVLFGIVESIIK